MCFYRGTVWRCPCGFPRRRSFWAGLNLWRGAALSFLLTLTSDWRPSGANGINSRLVSLFSLLYEHDVFQLKLQNFRVVFRKSLLKTQRHISQGFLYGKKVLPEQLALKVSAALTQVSVTPWDWSLLDPECPAEMRGKRVGREDGELRMQEKLGRHYQNKTAA